MASAKQIVSIIAIVIALVNMVAYGAGRISAIPFWIIIACCALVAFVFLPRLK